VLRRTKRSSSMLVSSRIQRQEVQHPPERMSASPVSTRRLLRGHRKRRLQVYLRGRLRRTDVRSSAELVRCSALPQRRQMHRAAATTRQPLPTSSPTTQSTQAEPPPPPPSTQEERSEKEKTPAKGKRKATERSIEKEKGKEGKTGAEERPTKTSKRSSTSSSSSSSAATTTTEKDETSKTPQEEGKTTQSQEKTGTTVVRPLEKLPLHLRGRLHWHLLRTGATSRQLRFPPVQGGSVVYRDRGRQRICVYVFVIVYLLSVHLVISPGNTDQVRI